LEACCEISEKKLAEGMQDMGAGGLLCASVEVVKRGREKTGKNIGCDIYIDKVPAKYALNNCDKLISESQERMLIVAQEKNKEEIFKIFKKWDLEYSVVGKSNNTGYYSVLDKTEEIFIDHIDMFDAETVNLTPIKQAVQTSEPIKVKNTELWTQYDNTIGGRTIKGPLEPGHYTILDVYEINKKIILSWGDNIETCKNTIEKNGGKALGVVNCLNFGDPKQCIGNFSKEIDILNTACVKHEIPVIGGNVSLYNSTNDTPIKPTVVLVMLGIIELP
jgi:phosphoribosylformylglycinamidine synthase